MALPGGGPGPDPVVGTALQAAAEALADNATALPDASPRLEAELLLMEATGWSRTTLAAWPERPVGPAAFARFQTLLSRRLAGEPMAYIRGRQAFWTLELQVSPDTLIPRPETELLVETGLELGRASETFWMADLGTGSGAVAAAIASERPEWEIIALDRSEAALAVAQSNFRSLGLARLHPLRGDWLAPIGGRRLDLILANPPYVPEGDPHLARGDPRFEPREALASGPDGLDAIRLIASHAARCLVAGGWLAVEHGYDQGLAVRRVFAKRGLHNPQTRRDLAGHERVTLARAP